MPVWSRIVLDGILILLNLLRFVLWPNIWPILENAPCVLKKNVSPAIFGWNVQKMFIRKMWSKMTCKMRLF